MNLGQALAYFLREALIGLARGWKTSLLAVMTIGFSLFLAGIFLLVSINLGSMVDTWRDESRIMVYLEEGSAGEDLTRVATLIESLPWVTAARPVLEDEARARFIAAYPSMADLLEGWDQDPLPASVAVEPNWQAVDAATLATTTASWREDPAVASVDDDRDWLAQLETVTTMLRGLATVVGGVLLTTAVFTIASVIRLAAHQHRDEITVLRLVGATEFYIRGPFYAEGAIQGTLGGLTAVGALAAIFVALQKRFGDGLLGSLVASRFLSPSLLVGLVALGAAAGLAGAILSLGREKAESARSAAGWGSED